MSKKDLVLDVAKYMMIKSRGFTKQSDWPIEWDTTRDDSQISMLIDDIEEILRFLEQNYGYKFPSGPSGTWTTGTVSYTATAGGGGSASISTSYPPAPALEEDGVQTEVKVRMSTGSNPTISEVREFLDRIEILGIQENTEVVGRLNMNLSFNDSLVYQITCGDCGDSDLVVSTHSCTPLNNE